MGLILDNNIVDRNIDRELNKPRSLKLTDHPSEVCPKCGSKLFTTAFVIKDVKGIEMGIIGRETVSYPAEQFPILVCAKCGEIAPAMYMDKNTTEMMEKLLGTEEKGVKEND